MDMNWVWAKLTIIAFRSMVVSDRGVWVIYNVQLRSMEEAALLVWYLNQPVGEMEEFQRLRALLKKPFVDEDFRKLPFDLLTMPLLRQRARDIALDTLYRDVYWNYVNQELGELPVRVTLTTKEPIAMTDHTKQKKNAIAAYLAAVNIVVKALEDARKGDEIATEIEMIDTVTRWTTGTDVTVEMLTELNNDLGEITNWMSQPNCPASIVVILFANGLSCITRAALDCARTETRSCHIDDTCLWWLKEALLMLRQNENRFATETDAMAEVGMAHARTLQLLEEHS